MYIIRSSKRLTTRAVANGPAGPVLAGPVFTSYCTYFAVKPPILLRGILRALLVMLSGCPAACRRPLQSLSREIMQSALC